MKNARGMEEGTLYGYARVSTKDQNEARQLDALEAYGIPEDRIFVDKQTGKNFNRPGYKRLIRTVNRGDTIVIKSIDRLGRNYTDIIDQWRMITQDIGCGIHVIDMPSLNTSGDPADLLSRFITDMMLQVLSFVAENERENTRQRQKEGIASAHKRGVKFGRPEVKIPLEFFDIYVRWKTKETPAMKLVEECKEKYKISIRTFYRRINELERKYGEMSIDEILKNRPTEDIAYTEEKAMAERGEYTSYNNNRYRSDAREVRRRWEKNMEDKERREQEKRREKLIEERKKKFEETVGKNRYDEEYEDIDE